MSRVSNSHFLIIFNHFNYFTSLSAGELWLEQIRCLKMTDLEKTDLQSDFPGKGLVRVRDDLSLSLFKGPSLRCDSL